MEDDQTVWLIIATKKFSDASKAKPHRMYVSAPQYMHSQTMDMQDTGATTPTLGRSFTLRSGYYTSQEISQ